MDGSEDSANFHVAAFKFFMSPTNTQILLDRLANDRLRPGHVADISLSVSKEVEFFKEAVMRDLRPVKRWTWRIEGTCSPVVYIRSTTNRFAPSLK